ncbi:glycosyltransferase [Sphingobacterium composti Ten et al. 2007 non Yoo et al. 2007]|uniref:glycosyltransferase n=1 Tax=Sphingobacterium composti TaxID=363260 RepID=UPI0013577C62|nr:glycosyltransferase [Sphingobacterium composti Ten et al. 2007 non Yoo et al. 2007]
MKILQLGKFYPIRGGVEKVMYDIMLGLSERGIYCDMLCASTEDYPQEDIKVNDFGNVFVVKTSIKAAATMLAPAMITRLIKIAANYDIIHIHHPDPMAALALLLSGYKGKVVLHWHSDILKQKTLLKLYKPLQNWLIKRANIIVGTTPVYVQESLFLKDVQDKIDYIPIGVLPISADVDLKESILRKHEDKTLIFSLGRLVEYKGFEYLIEAAKYLPVNYKVVIGGKGPLKDSLETLIAEFKLQDKVELLGFLTDEEAYAYFEVSKLFVLSSIFKTEAFAIVQIEAMSCGTPIITADIPGSGVSWVNQNEISGLICERKNAKDLAKSINLIEQNEILYKKLCEGAKNRFENNFHRDVMIDKTISLYSKLLAKT